MNDLPLLEFDWMVESDSIFDWMVVPGGIKTNCGSQRVHINYEYIFAF